MDKGKNLKLILPIKTKNNNKQCILHSNITWHSFTSKYSTQIHLSYTSFLATSLYNNSSPQLYPTGMLLACSMSIVGLRTFMSTVWTRMSAVFIHLVVSTMFNHTIRDLVTVWEWFTLSFVEFQLIAKASCSKRNNAPSIYIGHAHPAEQRYMLDLSLFMYSSGKATSMWK